MTNLIERYFGVDELGSTLRIEVLAGISTYASLAYIFVVNPAILGKAGMNVSAVFFATVVASAAATLFMGIWARLPFAAAPGLEMNGFFAFVVVGALGFTWREALGAVFWSGVLCVVFTILPVRVAVIEAIPAGLKRAMAGSVGIFVMMIGLVLAGIVSLHGGSIVGFDLSITAKVIALLIGLTISVALRSRVMNIPGGMLLGIMVAAYYGHSHGIVAEKVPIVSSAMLSAFGRLSLLPSHGVAFLSVLLVFFLLDFYGSIGKFIGLASGTSLLRGGQLPRIERALGVDGAGTIVGAILGTSSIITYVESAVGIAVGGRTGIVAVVCGSLMLLSLVFAPLISLVPVEATAGILVYVGYLLIRQTWKEGNVKSVEAAVLALMALTTILTFSLDKAMLLGFGAYTILSAKEGHPSRIMLVSTVLLLLAVVIPLFLGHAK